jgi:nifR3 family TIM-barrel protein
MNTKSRRNNFWQKIPKPILALAPMAGITDSAFRQICRKNGADMVYSEMASASALFFKPKKTLELLKFSKIERPYVVQLFGNKPEHFAKAAKIVSEKVKPDGIDINFGCPARKVFGHGSGCALMNDVKLARKIISAVCENTTLPVSIKIRAGVGKVTAEEFIEKVKDLPFSAVMIHGRTYEEGFAGPANFAVVEKIKKMIPDRIVLGNGGITEPQQAKEILEKHPLLDGLGIARGTLGRPWIFEEIKNILDSHSEQLNSFAGKRREESQDSSLTIRMTKQKIKKVAIAHAKIIYKTKGQKGFFEIRKHLAWYVKGLPNASELRRKLVQIESIKEIEKNLQ